MHQFSGASGIHVHCLHRLIIRLTAATVWVDESALAVPLLPVPAFQLKTCKRRLPMACCGPELLLAWMLQYLDSQ
jgi:hypothetical protein